MSKLKTPLRYAGGKTRAILKMSKYFPNLENCEYFYEPFLGGGSVSIFISQNYPNLKIKVSDLYKPLINFWKVLQCNGKELSSKILDLKQKNSTPDKARVIFNDAKLVINDANQNDFERAIAFYVVNKCSFSGLTEASSFSSQASDHNFTERSIGFLSEYSNIISNWEISCTSYEDVLKNCFNNSFIYLDPPYDIKDNLYGKNGEMHKHFDHDKFSENCNLSELDMMISYNSNQLVKNRFSLDKWKAYEYTHTYTMRSVGDYMRNQQERKELLLLNYDV